MTTTTTSAGDQPSTPNVTVWWAPLPPADAALVRFDVTGPELTAAEFGLREEDVVPLYPHLKKVAITGLHVSPAGVALAAHPVNYELCRALGRDPAALAGRRPDLSPDRQGAPAYPSIAAVHVLAVTSDNTLVMTQRSASCFSSPSTWSVSFEEQVEGAAGADGTVEDAVRRGALEEFGVGLASAVVLGVGRERDPDAGRICGVGVLVLAHLDAPWAQLVDALAGAQDRHEFAQVAGVHGIDLGAAGQAASRMVSGELTDPSDFAAALGGTATVVATVEAPVPSLGWHPSAAARVALAGRALAAHLPCSA